MLVMKWIKKKLKSINRKEKVKIKMIIIMKKLVKMLNIKESIYKNKEVMLMIWKEKIIYKIRKKKKKKRVYGRYIREKMKEEKYGNKLKIINDKE